jgi:hypothetical protein
MEVRVSRQVRNIENKTPLRYYPANGRSSHVRLMAPAMGCPVVLSDVILGHHQLQENDFPNRNFPLSIKYMDIAL